MVSLSSQYIKKFQCRILDWYANNKRDFPWRHTRDPYKILVSEVMSQQTQIQRVVPKYEAWIKAFPTVVSLAKGSVREVLTLWSGLGYNRRALFLQKCAQTIVKEYNGEFPQDEKTLLSLPGIGRYTAGAILCFAFDQEVAVLDTNIKKVILTQLVKKEHLSDKELGQIAKQILPKGKAYEWNQALMDYAGIILKKEKIRIPKQSKFHGSDRFIRGTVIKLLLADHLLTQEIIYQKLGEYMRLDKERFVTILMLLEKEGLIVQKGQMITLP